MFERIKRKLHEHRKKHIVAYITKDGVCEKLSKKGILFKIDIYAEGRTALNLLNAFMHIEQAKWELSPLSSFLNVEVTQNGFLGCINSIDIIKILKERSNKILLCSTTECIPNMHDFLRLCDDLKHYGVTEIHANKDDWVEKNN